MTNGTRPGPSSSLPAAKARHTSRVWPFFSQVAQPVFAGRLVCVADLQIQPRHLRAAGPLAHADYVLPVFGCEGTQHRGAHFAASGGFPAVLSPGGGISTASRACRCSPSSNRFSRTTKASSAITRPIYSVLALGAEPEDRRGQPVAAVESLPAGQLAPNEKNLAPLRSFPV